MRPLEAAELVDLATYARLRPEYRRAVIAHKRRRRMSVGDRVSLVFEDRETLRFQVQEMLFVERIDEPDRIQHELDVYNELMPGAREISATLFIEITELQEIRPELDRLVGLDASVALEIGDRSGADRIAARFDPTQLEEERLSAVQYLRFRLDPAQAARFEDPALPARIRIDHPAYTETAQIPGEVRASLAAGLRQEPAPLLDRDAVTPVTEQVWFDTGRVRAVEPPGSAGTHVLVELCGPDALDDALWRELSDALRRVAEGVAARHGSARIQADWETTGAAPRWHVHAGKSGAAR